MRLKKRFVITFLISAVLPVLLSAIAFWCIHSYQDMLLGDRHMSEYSRKGVVEGSYVDTDLNENYNKAERKIVTAAAISFAVIVFVSLAVSGAVLWWNYTGVIAPIKKLNEATKDIREGNLDFTVEVVHDDEIGRLCADFEELRQQLKELEARKKEYNNEHQILISNISHDLKTPITAIKGYVEGLMDGIANTPEKREKYLKTIYNKTNDMNRLISELTIYSGIDMSRIPYNYSKVSVSEYFEDCIEEISTELEAKNIRLDYNNYLKNNVIVIADAEQIKRAINNIISNSVKYIGHDHGVIRISIYDSNDYIQVEITDNGRGIAADDLPKIFDRFYRTDVSRNSAEGGSGIGLSIVKRIIEDHGGRVWAASQEGISTSILFELRKYEEVTGNE